jgi:plastocyanin
MRISRLLVAFVGPLALACGDGGDDGGGSTSAGDADGGSTTTTTTATTTTTDGGSTTGMTTAMTTGATETTADATSDGSGASTGAETGSQDGTTGGETTDASTSEDGTTTDATTGGVTPLNGCDGPQDAEDMTGMATVQIAWTLTHQRCILVDVGTTVEWSGNFAFHPLTGGETGNQDAASPITIANPANGVLEVTFADAGEYPYYCMVHLASMQGVVYVQ